MSQHGNELELRSWCSFQERVPPGNILAHVVVLSSTPLCWQTGAWRCCLGPFLFCREARLRERASANFRREVRPSSSYKKCEHASQLLVKSQAPSGPQGSTKPDEVGSSPTCFPLSTIPSLTLHFSNAPLVKRRGVQTETRQWFPAGTADGASGGTGVDEDVGSPGALCQW